MGTIREELGDRLIVHATVLGMWLLVELARRRDARLERALVGFSACYQFRTRAGAARRLIFNRGRVRSRAGLAPTPDYEVVLLDPPAVIGQLARKPNDVIRLLIEGKIDQRGNPFYLFKLGYLLGLCEQTLRGWGRALGRA